ncbi:MAG: S9 family peptidase [Flavobacteriaceae bacterium]|nr:S9 family peptidase [Flavobacteriaceae bacterium]MBL6684867.1 S9 family peptidase [Flavobacteriaceae bacterium]
MKNKVPSAKKIKKELIAHGDIRIDNYYWLNDKNDKNVIEYLNDENNFTKKTLKNTEDLQEILFDEMKSRIKEDDMSVPYFFNEYWYIKRFEKGKDYPIYTRKHKSLNNKEEILLDVNKLASKHAYYNVGSISVSPNNRILAYSFDTLSRRLYSIKFFDLKTKKHFKETIKNTTGSITWANDNKTIFYSKKEDKTLRVNKIYRHQLNSNVDNDVLVFEEKDDQFSTGIYKTKSQKFLIIASRSTLTSEMRFLNANNPNEEFQLFAKREKNHEYSINHFGDSFYILTNSENSKNFRIMRCSVQNTSISSWEEIKPHSEEILIEDIELFNEYFVISEREKGLVKFRIKKWNTNDEFYLPFDGETYNASLGINLDFNSKKLRYNFTSLTNPSSVIEFDMSKKSKNILKTQEVVDENFKSSNYESKRVWAISHDGTKVPISVVKRKETIYGENTPLLLYGYGSYGITIDPYFSSTRLSLLDRGFVFAIAHVRGSEYLGRDWYENGKLLKKKNTFLDFISSAKYLISKQYTSSKNLYAMGGSAGGLLMGAVVNMEPELFNGVIAAVPFVDVITTMLDESIPLTTLEYDEWGNPNDLEFYNYMLSYSPYDNISNLNYPNLLITTGLHDSQVQYWEPAKWIAKLRDYNRSKNHLLLHTNMDTGHGGASGRFNALKEIAMEYAFLIGLEQKLF